MWDVCDVLGFLSDLLFMSRDDAWYWTEPSTDLQHCSFAIFDGTTTVRSSLSRVVLIESLLRFRRAQRQRISPSPEPQFITTLHPLSPLDPPYPLSSPLNTSGKSRLSGNSTADPSKMTHQQFESPTLVDQQTHHPVDSVRRKSSFPQLIRVFSIRRLVERCCFRTRCSQFFECCSLAEDSLHVRSRSFGTEETSSPR